MRKDNRTEIVVLSDGSWDYRSSASRYTVDDKVLSRLENGESLEDILRDPEVTRTP